VRAAHGVLSENREEKEGKKRKEKAGRPYFLRRYGRPVLLLMPTE
jgi:hypothetical protein